MQSTDATATTNDDASVTYTWTSHEAVIIEYADGSIFGEVASAGIYGNFNVDGSWWVEMNNDCLYISQSAAGEAVSVVESENCSSNPVGLIEAIQGQIALLMTSTDGDITALLEIFTAATEDSEATVTTAADGSTHYTWTGGESINIATDGSIIASSQNDGLYGTFNADGTWSIEMYNDCMTLAFDGTDVTFT